MSNWTRVGRSRQAFTLMELLVVILVIGVLVAMLVPALSKARAKAKAVACANNLRQLHAGMVFYLEDNRGRFPKASHLIVDIFPYLSSSHENARKLACPAARWPGYDPSDGESHLLRTGYGTNPCLIPPDVISRSWPDGVYVNRNNIFRESEVLLFADAGQMYNGRSAACAQWWGEYDEVGFPHRVNEAQADDPVSEAAGGGIGQLGWMPEGETLLNFRHRGKAQGVFLDGHVGTLEPGRVLQRNLHAVY